MKYPAEDAVAPTAITPLMNFRLEYFVSKRPADSASPIELLHREGQLLARIQRGSGGIIGIKALYRERFL